MMSVAPSPTTTDASPESPGHAPTPAAQGRRSVLEAPRSLFRVELGTHAFPALDGMRGLAASLVFLVHYHAAFASTVPATDWLGRHPQFPVVVGFQGVNIFFALSGFLIYGALIDRPTRFVRFFKRRVRRIYPTFLAVLALYIVLGLVFESRSKLPEHAPWLFVLQNALLLPGVFDVRPIITVSWSLSYEFYFYVGLALLVLALQLRRWPRWTRVAVWSAVVAAWVLGGPAPRAAMGSFAMFLPGLLVYEAVSAAGPGVRVPAPFEASVWVAFAATLVWVGLGGAASVGGADGWGLPTAVLSYLVLGSVIGTLLFVAVRGTGAVARGLAWRPIRYVGTVSYSFYLIHGLTINAVALTIRALGGQGTQPGEAALPGGLAAYLLFAPVVYALCVVSSVVLYQAVERRTLELAPAHRTRLVGAELGGSALTPPGGMPAMSESHG